MFSSVITLKGSKKGSSRKTNFWQTHKLKHLHLIFFNFRSHFVCQIQNNKYNKKKIKMSFLSDEWYLYYTLNLFYFLCLMFLILYFI